MADRKISDLTALTTPASGDFLPIVDISEAAAATKNKRITIQSLLQGIPVNVGIGTSNPQAPLHVFGAEGLRVETAASSEGYIRFVNTSGSMSIGMGGAVGNNLLIFDRTNNQSAYIYTGGAGGYHAWNTNNTERLRITSAGLVGIGTSSPTELLNVNGNIALDTVALNAPKFLQFKANSDGTGTPSYGGITWYNYQWDATKRAEISSGPDGGVAAGYLAFSTGSTGVTERLRISASGNVGIGTTSPTALLDVNADTVRVRTARTPASATATGATGEICWDANYIYVAVGTNTWKRAALSTW